MATNTIKVWALVSLFSLSAYCTAQSTVSKTENAINTQKMENKILIGEVFIPKNSIEEFYKQNVTTGFLNKPDLLKGRFMKGLMLQGTCIGLPSPHG